MSRCCGRYSGPVLVVVVEFKKINILLNSLKRAEFWLIGLLGKWGKKNVVLNIQRCAIS